MSNDVIIFNNDDLNLKVRTMLNEDGSISINAEDTAIGFGWSKTETKNGKQYTSIRWETVNNYCKEFGFDNKLSKDDYIPESLFYMLGMKANNKVALEFQKWLAVEVLPSIRQTGTYSVNQQQGQTYAVPQPLDVALRAVNAVADGLKVNESSRLLMYNKAYAMYNMPTSFLPDYVSNGNREIKSATYCLKQIGASMSTTMFNKLLIGCGYLEEKQRTSTSAPNNIKSYKALTDKGLKYGENLISPNNPRETQPQYYADTFKELYDIVTNDDVE